VTRFRFRRRTTTMAGLRPVQPRPESVARTTRTFTSRWPEADAPRRCGYLWMLRLCSDGGRTAGRLP
jgi:hypothetical protein